VCNRAGRQSVRSAGAVQPRHVRLQRGRGPRRPQTSGDRLPRRHAPARAHGVTSFFGNISDVWAIVNNLLQGKGEFAADSLARVTTNTLWGLGGIFDVATELKIPKHSEDFGQTLGVWGVGSGPYLVLPLLGPSSVRDTAGLVVDSQLDLVTQASNVRVRNSLTTLRVVNVRANLLGAGDVLDQAALDKYSFTREIYQQRRTSLIGNAPAEKEERFDLPEGAPAAPAAR
jgi:phospholipid-binding lipoprotein MlaA